MEGHSGQEQTTLWARGTPGYRAPELLLPNYQLTGSDNSRFSKKSDIWALGCILYELAFKTKAFPRDINVFEYAHHKRRVDIHDLPMTERVKAYLRELVYRMLEIE